ncbi:Putative membrane protein [Rhodovulum sp. P5]|uniref:YdcF family protein n=1 Tax=Rhodovulum sp. P5 TaxID=1564506 RepID=UPI0009C1C9FE|nr:YdcF family protein [Rhodovulum sp. P5]ARE41362.1 Putative membrane protein [Rhodovulum sp. P5]
MADLFFLASKIVWGMLRADTLIVILMGVGVVALLRDRAVLGAVCVALAFVSVLVVALTPLPNRLLYSLESRYPVPDLTAPVAGIVILGGAEDPTSTAEWGLPRVNEAGSRFLAALSLAERFPDAAVMFTGGSGKLSGSDMPEAEVARLILTGAGLDDDRLILEGASRNTAENAAFAARAVPDRTGRWVLVSSAYHMPRAVETFCAAGWRDLVPYPVDFRSRKRLRLTWQPAEQFVLLNLSLKEYLGLAVYRATGRAVHPLPDGCLAAQ